VLRRDSTKAPIAVKKKGIILYVLYLLSACMNHANFERSHNYYYSLTRTTAQYFYRHIHPTTSEQVYWEYSPWMPYLFVCVAIHCVFVFFEWNLFFLTRLKGAKSTYPLLECLCLFIENNSGGCSKNPTYPKNSNSFHDHATTFWKCYENNLMFPPEWISFKMSKAVTIFWL